MIPKNYIKDDGVLKTIDALKRGEPVIYLAGKAGVGKSTFIHYIKQHTSRKHVVVAPTGIAALNIEGQTIHSFFRFAPRIINKMEIKNRDDDLIKNLELIIIDEVSMVRADVMDAIDYALRKWRKDKRPFGGIQMLMVGDCFQLAPVVTRHEKEIFNNTFKSPWFFDAEVFKNVDIFPIELKHIYRQNDKRFIQLLHNIRIKNDLQNTIDVLNRECDIKQKESALYLTATNDFANIVNRDMLDELPGEKFIYNADRIGYINLIGENLPVPSELKLKVGARVMVRKNIMGAVNGSLGTVLKCSKNSVDVELDKGGVIGIAPETWTTYKYTFDSVADKVQATVLGKYTQIPLALGWAVTIHKSQSLTLDSVEIDFGRGCFSHGQCYTALSRCRKIETLKLTEPLNMRDIIIDDEVIEFHNKMFGDK